jgi:hypothetical protein
VKEARLLDRGEDTWYSTLGYEVARRRILADMGIDGKIQADYK